VIGAEDDGAADLFREIQRAQRLSGDGAGVVDAGVGDDDHLRPEGRGRRCGEGRVDLGGQNRRIVGVKNPCDLGGMHRRRWGRRFLPAVHVPNSR
jgi:hypothetical protein